MDVNLVEQLLAVNPLGTEWILWLLIALSHFSVAIALERLWYFFRHRPLDKTSLKNLISCIESKRYQEAIAFCQSRPYSYEAGVALEGLLNLDQGRTSMRQAMLAHILRHGKGWDKGLMVLATLGNNSPFIGLFGTVIGIIKSFHDLGLNPTGGAAVVMAGISEALVATAVGLLVAIPAVIFYNAFQRRVKIMLRDSEALMNEVLAKHP